MESSMNKLKTLEFASDVDFDLKNYVDMAILQTIIDSEKENDGPLRIIEKPLFKGTQQEKIIDRLIVNQSAILPLIYNTKPQDY